MRVVVTRVATVDSGVAKGAAWVARFRLSTAWL